MTREERCELAIQNGYKYNSETGKITGIRGKEVTAKQKGYNLITLVYDNKGYRLYAHQLAWYWINKECVEQLDHINGDRSDNRISNLRSVTNQQNSMNRTKAKGYTWCKERNNWRSQITLNNKTINLGYFEKEEDARNTYLQAKEKYHKKYLSPICH
jgi:hypothetical protein